MNYRIIYPTYRKYYCIISWNLSYFYMYIICVFFFYPEMVNMNLDNIDPVILTVLKITCIIDIIISGIFKNLVLSIGFFILWCFSSRRNNQECKNWCRSLIDDIYPNERIYDKYSKIYDFFYENYYLHGSFSYYTIITAIYTTIVFVMNFTLYGYILWGIYLFLLVNCVFSINYSLYREYFKFDKFVINSTQLLDLATDYAFIYEINGLNKETIEEYGLPLLISYLFVLFCSWISFIYLAFIQYNIRKYERKVLDTIIQVDTVDGSIQNISNRRRAPSQNENQVERYKKKETRISSIYGFNDIILATLTIILHNIDNNIDNDETVTVLTVTTSIMSFIMTFSEIITENCQKDLKNIQDTATDTNNP